MCSFLATNCIAKHDTISGERERGSTNMTGSLFQQRGTMHHGYMKNRTSLSQIHDSIGINQIPGLWGGLLYIPLSLTSLILAFQHPSREHVCHLGLGDNSKVWLWTIQSLALSPSLSPCSFAIHQVLKEGCPLHHLQKREEKHLSEESGFELGLNFSSVCQYKSQRLISDSLGFALRIQAAGERRSIKLKSSGYTHSKLPAQKRLCAKETLIWITLKVKEKDCFIS